MQPRFVHPAKRVRLDSRVFEAQTFGGIQSHKLPATVLEMVVDLLFEGLVVSRSGNDRAILEIVVISNHDVNGHPERVQYLTDCALMFWPSMFSQITCDEAKFSSGMRLHLPHQLLQPRAALRTHVMQVIYNQKPKGPRLRLSRPQRPRPAPKRPQHSCAQVCHDFSTRKIWHSFTHFRLSVRGPTQRVLYFFIRGSLGNSGRNSCPYF